MRTGSPMSSTKMSPPRPTRPRLHDQLRGLGDRHEEARRSRVGDRHRAAAGDLLRKIGTTEPDEPSTLPKRTATKSVSARAGQRLDDPLGERLAGAHRRWSGSRPCRSRRARSGRRRDAPPAAPGARGRARCCAAPRAGCAAPSAARACRRPRGRRRQAGASSTIVAHARRVAHVADLRARSRSCRPRAVRARSGRGCSRRGRAARAARPRMRELAAQLGADRAAGARHEHDAVAHVGADLARVELHRLASEHVLDLHLAQLARPGRRRRS